MVAGVCDRSPKLAARQGVCSRGLVDLVFEFSEFRQAAAAPDEFLAAGRGFPEDDFPVDPVEGLDCLQDGEGVFGLLVAGFEKFAPQVGEAACEGEVGELFDEGVINRQTNYKEERARRIWLVRGQTSSIGREIFCLDSF